MDTVILAAGRGTRLEGIAAPFWKPLFVVNGEPLVVKLVKQARLVSDDRIVVVVSPENAQPICQVLAANLLDDVVDVVVQPSPAGPGSAFLRAAPFLGGTAMILCADNVMPDTDIRRCAESVGTPLVIGTRPIEDPNEAARFTLISESGRISEGSIEHTMVWSCDGRFRAWVGPLIVDAGRLSSLLERITPDGELKIGEWLEKYRDGADPVLIDCDAYDIGSPDDGS